MRLLRLCLPDGPVRVTTMSGTPETFEVNAMVPFAKAARGLPDGAIVTESVSTTSAYSSFEVCLTLARRHGRAGAVWARRDGELEGLFAPKPDFLSAKSAPNSPTGHAFPTCAYVGRFGKFRFPRSFPIKPSTSTRSRNAFGSVVLIVPASHISVRSWAATS